MMGVLGLRVVGDRGSSSPLSMINGDLPSASIMAAGICPLEGKATLPRYISFGKKEFQ